MEVKNESNQAKELEADARNVLLAHYSSKSTNETAVLIGLAVIVFADFQAYSVLNVTLTWLKITFLTLSLGIIAFLVIRQLSRLIMWGQLADIIVSVKMASVRETEIELDKKRVKDKRIDLDTTYLERLAVGCDLRFRDLADNVNKGKRENKESSSSFWDRLPLQIYVKTHSKHFVGWSFSVILLVLTISLAVAYAFFSLF